MAKTLLDNVQATEINWEQVAPILRNQPPGSIPFIYVIAEPDPGPVKIGQAANPVKRLRELQIGNPRRLSIERLLFGDQRCERLLHSYFREHAISGSPRRSELNAQYRRETEWFSADARTTILHAAGTIMGWQRLYLPVDPTLDDLYLSIGAAMSEAGFELKEGDTVKRLGRDVGYVSTRLRA